MFAIILNYLKPIEELDTVRPRHRDHLKEFYDKGIFLVSGPRTPRFGGFILAHKTTREDLTNIMNQDPFIKEGVADYQIIEFDPIFCAKELESILKLHL